MKSAKNSFLKNYTALINTKKTFIFIFCLMLSLLSIFPFWVTFVNATRENYSIQQSFTLIPGSMLMTNMANLIDRGSFNVFNGLFNSFFISATSTILTVYFSTLTAYGLTVYDFKLKGPAFTFILAVLMIPTQVSAVGFYRFMYELNIDNTFIPIILPTIAAPTIVFFMRQYMKATFQISIVEAARIDGASEFATFNVIGFPIMKPAIATQAIFAFITSWNNFFTPAMVLSDVKKYTLPLMVQMLKSDRFRTDFGLIYLGVAISIIPLIVVYLFFSKYIIAGVAMGGVKE